MVPVTLISRGFREDLGVVVVGGGDDDRLGAGNRFSALLGVVFDIERGGAFLHKDAGADENRLGTQLHHQSRVGRGGDAARPQVRNRQNEIIGIDASD